MRTHPLLVACVLASACVTATAQTTEPGLWEIHNKMLDNLERKAAASG